jgi:hypothetical protein
MLKRISPRTWFAFCILALLAGGCATEVAVSPEGSTITSYSNIWGSLSGNVSGSVDSAFHATNRALDGLGYFRVGQKVTPVSGSGLTKACVYARGLQDVKATVEITPSPQAGMALVVVSLSPHSLPQSQAVFSAILKELNTAGPGG